MTITARESGFYGWERKSPLFPDGRMSVSLRTKDKKEAGRRARALDLLLERGEVSVLQRLRAGDVHVAELTNAVRDQKVDELRGGSLVDLTLGAMVDRVIAAKEATRSASTQKQYRKITRALLRRWDKDRSIVDISTDELRAWLYEPKKGGRPWAANTQSGAMMVAGHLWRVAIDLEAEAAHRMGIRPRIVADPWAKIEANARPTPRRAFLEPPEWRVVLQHSKGLPVASLVSLCCLGGLRISEALNLRTTLDVDLKAGLIRVQSRDGEFAWTTKHHHSQRDVPIVGGLREVLEEHTESGFAGARYFIHTNQQDRPMSYESGRKLVKSAFERAGLKYGQNGELTAHSLRHSFASWLIREGWSSSLVAKLMGNTAAEVDRTYAHLQPTDLTKVVLTLDRLVAA